MKLAIRISLLLVLLVAALTAVAGVLYLTNAAPTVPALDPGEAARAGKPYVVKLHAQWCPVCMRTKGVWSEIADAYATRVNLVVLDFTNDADTEASRIEAARLGLQPVFDEYAGATGIILVLDAKTRGVTAELDGIRDIAEYRAAIDAALAEAGTASGSAAPEDGPRHAKARGVDHPALMGRRALP